MESQTDSFYPITFLVNPYRMCYTILVTASRNFQVFPDILNAKEKMRMRILIVEDEKDLANVLSEMLELEGYHTDIANDGEIVP